MKPLLSVLSHIPCETPCVWLMRQAGRYLPEYRALRSQYSTLTLFKTPKLASEITLQPIHRFPQLDGAIVYADILLIPDAMGLGLDFMEGEGPIFKKPPTSVRDIEKLIDGDPLGVVSQLFYVGETIARVKEKLPAHTTLLGFAGAPWTVVSYILEGAKGQSRDFLETKRWMYTEPKLFHALMDWIARCTTAYLNMQREHGIEAFQLFETWAGYALGPEDYAHYAFPHTQKILQGVALPSLHFCGLSAPLFTSISKLSCTGHSLDWRIRWDDVMASGLFEGKVLQGNLDPSHLFFSKPLIRKHTLEILNQFKNYGSGFIFNLGHGIKPKTPLENVEYLINCVKSKKD